MQQLDKLPDIHSLIPHTGTMALLDRVIAADENSLCAEVTIRPDSLFCGSEGVGAWVGIEYMAQAIAAYAGYVAQQNGGAVKVGFLLGSRRYECSRAFFAPMSVLRIQVQLIFQADNGLGSFECTITDSNDPQMQLATATLTVFQPDNLDAFLTMGTATGNSA